VYIYPAQTDPRVHPLGGDARYRFSADGLNLTEKHQMHRTILEISSDGDSNHRMVAGFHTDIFGDVPEDTDVFHVLTRQPPMPDYVSVNGELYEIGPDGAITDTGSVKH